MFSWFFYQIYNRLLTSLSTAARAIIVMPEKIYPETGDLIDKPSFFAATGLL